ncbi:MAG: M10 family metallopeptidase C-terminal domain-containing protein [Pseudomonadota bacterium]|nr:M10 family metallopeptidase C-terminal domain-containing protein [Pseudomonadota bacterium]
MPTQNEIIEALQFPGLYALGPVNTTAAPRRTVSYQFETSQPADLWYTYTGWTAFSGAEKSVFRFLLETIETFLNVDFVEVSGDSDPDLNFGKVDMHRGTAGLGGPQYSNAGTRITAFDGFAVFNNTIDLASGEQALILHEIGHAMGLDHTFDGATLDPAYDNLHYSLMSYDADPTPGISATVRMMVYDILALQDLWGAASYYDGNTSYLGPRLSAGLVDVVWDSGGTDWLDASAWGRAVHLDLGQGMFSRWNGTEDMVIAYNTVIENARGSGFGDTVIGNDGPNLLYGGGGTDLVRGRKGDDTVYGDDQNDEVRGGAGDDLVYGGAGNDIVKGTPGDDRVYGEAGNDLVKGGPGNDRLYGGPGNDDLRGWRGNDLLDGGTGDDRLRGGVGDDTFIFKPGYDRDTITDLGKGDDTLRITGFGDEASVMSRAVQSGSDVVIDFGGGDILTLEDTTLAIVEAALST